MKNEAPVRYSPVICCVSPPVPYQAQLEAKRDAFVKKNMDMSSAHCSDLLEGLFAHLEEEVKQGTFYKPGGYYLFLQRKQELEKKYIQTPGKGLQVNSAVGSILWCSV